MHKEVKKYIKQVKGIIPFHSKDKKENMSMKKIKIHIRILLMNLEHQMKWQENILKA